MYAATSTYHSQLINVPKLKTIIFAEFDADKGPVIRIQVSENSNSFRSHKLTHIYSVLHNNEWYSFKCCISLHVSFIKRLLESDSDEAIIILQVPDFLFDAKTFDTFSNAIIPKPELFHRLIKVNHVENSDGKVYKVMGHPVGIGQFIAIYENAVKATLCLIEIYSHILLIKS